MKHLSTLIAVKNLTIIQFTKIIQDLFYLDEFILDSLIIHLENCTIYHDESAIAFCIQYQNNDYEYIFNEAKQNIYLSINKRNNQFIDLITYLNKYHFLNNNHFSYIQPNIKNMNDLNQVIEFIENKTILPVIYLNISLKDFKNEILTEIQSTAYILTSEDENFHQAFQKHFHLRNNSYILYLNHEFQKISFLKKESPQEFIEKVKIKIQSYVLQRTYSFPYNMKDYQIASDLFKQFIQTYPESSFAEECLYMMGFCDYKASPKPRLDQQVTEKAIREFQLYLSRYPYSMRKDKVNTYMDEMRDKLSYKAYLSAKNYYLREHYKAAVISLQNCLKDYPGSKYREEIMYMLFVSKYQMAVNSVEDKKVERYNNAREEYYYFADEYPNSRYAADVKKMYEDIEAYLENYKFED